jgi:hypothetical protein
MISIGNSVYSDPPKVGGQNLPIATLVKRFTVRTPPHFGKNKLIHGLHEFSRI